MSDDQAKKPTDREALEALKRFRQHMARSDREIVERWLTAAKDNQPEYARRLHLTC